MNDTNISKNDLIKLVISRFLLALFVLGLVFFLPAWTFAYWQAWIYLCVLFTPLIFMLIYLVNRHPDLLVRRMRFQEKQSDQKRIIQLSLVPSLLAFILPGFDVRLGWSNVPPGMAILGDALVLIGYAMVFMTFRENRYASRIVEVEKDQTVISSGPYAIVRHPMYSGSALLYVFTPLALGSYWAIIPGLLIIPVLVARIISEEKMLVKELRGYDEYRKKTRYRLIPGVW